MNDIELESLILKELISTFEKLSTRSKGMFLHQIGQKLYNESSFILASNYWNHALNFFIEDRDKEGESHCYTNLGNAYRNLGDFKKAIN